MPSCGFQRLPTCSHPLYLSLPTLAMVTKQTPLSRRQICLFGRRRFPAVAPDLQVVKRIERIHRCQHGRVL